MITSPIFYDEPELYDVQARVLKVIPAGPDSLGLVLDRTPFYPEGGGQPCDLGTISGFAVLSVSWVGDEIVHIVSTGAETGPASGIPDVGSAVHCFVDMARRMDHTEQHTAQHLLSATVLRVLEGPTKSFHLGERYSSIDVDIPMMDRSDADSVEAAVLEVIRADYPVITHLCPPEDVESFPLRRKPPAGEDILRILEIDGLDFTPCAGTHLRRTGAIGAFRILRTEKYKGMTRIFFIAGERAYADYMKLAGLIRETAAVAGCAEDDVASFMAGAVERTARLEGELKACLDHTAILEARSLLDGRLVLPGIELSEHGPDSSVAAGFIVLSCIDRDFTGASRLAKAMAGLGRPAIVASLPDHKIAAAASDGAVDIGKLLKPLMLSCGGKGGGTSLFQAAFPGSQELGSFLDALRGPAV